MARNILFRKVVSICLAFEINNVNLSNRRNEFFFKLRFFWIPGICILYFAIRHRILCSCIISVLSQSMPPLNQVFVINTFVYSISCYH